MENCKRIYLLNLINEILENLERNYKIDSNCTTYHRREKYIEKHHFEFFESKIDLQIRIIDSELYLIVRKIFINDDRMLFRQKVSNLEEGDIYQAMVLIENEIFKKFPGIKDTTATKGFNLGV